MTEAPLRLIARPSADGASPAADPLSDMLRAVRLTGALLFLVDASRPWLTQAPATPVIAPVVMPTAQHLVSFHVVTAGRCWGGLADDAPRPLAAGDVLVVPHGDAYRLCDPPSATAPADDAEAVAFFREMAAGRLPAVVREGGDGAERTEFVCGFLGCDRRPFNPVLASLPRVVHLRGAAAASSPLSHLVDAAVAELRVPRAGGRDMLLRLAELMFVEVVRGHLAASGGAERGWLAGLADPVVARALALLHDRPARPWTLAMLAAEVGASRTVLTGRFGHCIGQPPMRYLHAWRMQLAMRLLPDDGAKVGAVAASLGYGSEAAFSRAFKKHAGRSPSDWRRR